MSAQPSRSHTNTRPTPHTPNQALYIVLLFGILLCVLLTTACEKNNTQCPTPEPTTQEPNNKEPNTTPDASPPEKSTDLKPTDLPPKAQPQATTCGTMSHTFATTFDENTVSNTPPGRPLLCQQIVDRSKLSIQLDPLFTVSSPTATYGSRLLRILYTTQTPDGRTYPASALLYLPLDDQNHCVNNAPIAVVNHGTSGTAPMCGPSRSPALSTDYMALPLVGRGYAVLLPDYLGLGLPSSIGHPYLVPEPTNSAILDAIKALLKLSDEGPLKGCTQPRVMLLGHSQGGHAALIAAGAFKQQLPQAKLVATIAYAPAFGRPALWTPTLSANLQTTAGTAYLLMYLMGLSRYHKTPAPETWLTTTAAKTIPPLLSNFCFYEFSKFIQTTMPTIGQIFSPAFIDATSRCQSGKGDCKAFQPWFDWIQQTTAGLQAPDSPVLLVQGSKDLLVTSDTVQCIANRLSAKQTPTQQCVYPNADHSTIVSSAWKGINAWIDEAMQGLPPKTLHCPSNTLPKCPD